MKKYICLTPCNGQGYKNFKKGEVRSLPEKLAKKLLQFRYIKEVQPSQELTAEEMEKQLAAEKEKLINSAKELGIEGVNKNWGIEKLKEAITQAEAEMEPESDGTPESEAEKDGNNNEA